MTGAKRRFGIERRPRGGQLADDFAAVFAGDLASRPSVPLDVPIDAIEASPYQARIAFADLDELVEAIRIHGFTSRIRVRPHPTVPDTYQLVFGERRLRAARAAGLTTIPAEVAAHSDDELREIGLTENLLRRDLTPLEEGRAFVAALDAGYSVRRLAERIGKADKGYVENRVAVARAPEDVQAMVAERPTTLRAARELTKLDSERERRPLIDALLAGTITSDDVADVVREQRSRNAGAEEIHAAVPGTPTETISHRRSATTSHGDSAANVRPERGDGRAREQRAHTRRRRQLEAEVVQVLTVIGRWREAGVHDSAEREVLGRGITRILADLDVLLRALEQSADG